MLSSFICISYCLGYYGVRGGWPTEQWFFCLYKFGVVFFLILNRFEGYVRAELYGANWSKLNSVRSKIDGFNVWCSGAFFLYAVYSAASFLQSSFPYCTFIFRTLPVIGFYWSFVLHFNFFKLFPAALAGMVFG